MTHVYYILYLPTDFCTLIVMSLLLSICSFVCFLLNTLLRYFFIVPVVPGSYPLDPSPSNSFPMNVTLDFFLSLYVSHPPSCQIRHPWSTYFWGFVFSFSEPCRLLFYLFSRVLPLTPSVGGYSDFSFVLSLECVGPFLKFIISPDTLVIFQKSSPRTRLNVTSSSTDNMPIS